VSANGLTVYVVTVLFCATFIRSTFGFGEALFAVPLLAFVLPIDVAAPVGVLVSITVAAIVAAQDWRHVQGRIAGRLVLFSALGIPLGLLLLRSAAEPSVKAALGVIVAAFALFALLSHDSLTLHNDSLAWMFGISAGILGGAYGMNGPPLAVYGSLRRWPPAQFRATLQAYFLPASLMGMIGYWIAGLWTPSVNRYYLKSLPAVLVAIVLGRWTGKRLDARRFLLYVHCGLLAIGVALLLQAALPL
jgi:uncharacterized membrane protein YfcA